MVSQPAYLKALKDYARPLVGEERITPVDGVETALAESDRGAVILAATRIEDTLEWAIMQRMKPLWNDATSRSAMFGPNGIAGTFAAKILMAFSLGIIDREARNDIDLIREMRNACAHARREISFKQEVLAEVCRRVVREALPHLTSTEGVALRHAFMLVCVLHEQYIISGHKQPLIEAAREALAEIERESSLRKSPPRSSPDGR